ncbi:MAG: pyridoxine 5'-phosphate synthase, partial [Burkholderiaceae bacterium]
PNQVTSDHGWDLDKNAAFLREVCAELKVAGIRVSLFVDYDCPNIALAKELGADRVELYTEPYAETYGTPQNDAILAQFGKAAEAAQAVSLGVNAGHDLNLENLAKFIALPNILEVSIGHALIVECLEQGMDATMRGYTEILNK